MMRRNIDIKDAQPGDMVVLKGLCIPLKVLRTKFSGNPLVVLVEFPFLHYSDHNCVSFFVTPDDIDHIYREVADIPEFNENDNRMHFLVSEDGTHRAVYMNGFPSPSTPIMPEPCDESIHPAFTSIQLFVHAHPDWLPMHEIGEEKK